MKKNRIFMAAAFLMSITAAFAFKPSGPLATKSTATAYYTVTTACDNSTTCSNVVAPACVSGVTSYFTNTSCNVTSAFKYKP